MRQYVCVMYENKVIPLLTSVYAMAAAQWLKVLFTGRPPSGYQSKSYKYQWKALPMH